MHGDPRGMRDHERWERERERPRPLSRNRSPPRRSRSPPRNDRPVGVHSPAREEKRERQHDKRLDDERGRLANPRADIDRYVPSYDDRREDRRSGSRMQDSDRHRYDDYGNGSSGRDAVPPIEPAGPPRSIYDIAKDLGWDRNSYNGDSARSGAVDSYVPSRTVDSYAPSRNSERSRRRADSASTLPYGIPMNSPPVMIGVADTGAPDRRAYGSRSPNSRPAIDSYRPPPKIDSYQPRLFYVGSRKKKIAGWANDKR
ncbi:hypothetical protein BC829DRAFT_383143 [Chytridium lagenaria]|nr:hypothetical protein BC829DRAFT_383143 [Chytridium lagenaria]